MYTTFGKQVVHFSLVCSRLASFIKINMSECRDKVKRKRVVLSIENKLEIINLREKGASSAKIQLQFGIGETTVRRIMQQRAELLSFSSKSENSLKKRKTMKNSMYEDLDKAVLEWFSQQRAQGTPISGPIIAHQAKIFFQQLGYEGEFDASSGWLTRFKERHGVRELSIQGEKLSANQEGASQFRGDFQKLVLSKNLLPEQIYNADETGLFWKCLPTKTLAFTSEVQAPGHKASKERLTVLCCSNAAGDHKLKLVVIGKSKKPRSFKGTRAVNMPVNYYSQKSAVMDCEIFRDWFQKHFVPEVLNYLQSKNLPQRAVLLIDNAPSHPSELQLKSSDGEIFVKFLPPNVSSIMQPMDQGVIACMKKHYRTGLLLKRIEEGCDFKTFWKDFTILDAIYEIRLAWEKVKAITLLRSWRKSLPDISEESDHLGFTEEEIISVTELTKLLNSVAGGEKVDEENIEEWFDVDLKEQGFELLSNEEIIRRAQGVVEEAANQSGSDEEEADTLPPKSHSEAIVHVDGLLEYLERQPDSLLCDKLMLRRLRSQIKINSNKSKKQTNLKNYFKKL